MVEWRVADQVESRCWVGYFTGLLSLGSRDVIRSYAMETSAVFHGPSNRFILRKKLGDSVQDEC